jgi:hypothetical protein
MITINTSLLRETLAHIEANPEEWRQATYRCPSGMCFAGHAVTLAGGRWPAEPGSRYQSFLIADGDDLYQDVRWIDREGEGKVQVVHAEDRARRVLGLTLAQASRLFAGVNDLHRLTVIVSELCEEAER